MPIERKEAKSIVVEFKHATKRGDSDDLPPHPPAGQRHPAGNRPAVVAMEREFDRIIRQVEETANPRIVARRFGVGVADVNRLVAIRLRDARRAA